MASRLRACIAVLLIVAASAGLPMAVAATRTVTVATREIAPFVIEKNNLYSGFTVELWDEIARRRGWTTQYVNTENVKAQLNAVAEGRADVAAGAVSITTERRQKFDFSQPIFNAGLQILVRHEASAPAAPGLGSFLPLLFSRAMFVWLLAGLLLTIIPAHIFWLVERRRPDEDEEDGSPVSRSYFPGIFQSFAWGLGFLGFMPDTFPHRALGRLLGVLWGFVAVIFVSYFTANLTTTLTVNTYSSQINGPSDLTGKKVATVAGTTAAQHLKDLGVDANGLPNIDDCYRGLRDGTFDAVVFDSPILRYYAAGDGAGSVQLTGPIFNAEDYGFGFRQESDLRSAVDESLLSIRQDGTYDLIKRKWFGDDSQAGNEPG